MITKFASDYPGHIDLTEPRPERHPRQKYQQAEPPRAGMMSLLLRIFREATRAEPETIRAHQLGRVVVKLRSAHCGMVRNPKILV
jgi:hypothetical protein